MNLTTKISATFIVVIMAMMSTSCVTAQSLSTDSSITSPAGSAIFSLQIIGNTSVDPAVIKAVQSLINATRNATNEVGKIIRDAANRTIANGNITVQNIQQFLQTIQGNISKIQNATIEDLKAALSTVMNFVQSNATLIQTRIKIAVALFVNVLQTIIASLNNITDIPPITLPPFPFSNLFNSMGNTILFPGRR